MYVVLYSYGMLYIYVRCAITHVYAYICIYAHTHVHTYICIFAYTYTYTCTHMYVCIHVYVYIYIYVCVYIYIYIIDIDCIYSHLPRLEGEEADRQAGDSAALPRGVGSDGAAFRD